MDTRRENLLTTSQDLLQQVHAPRIICTDQQLPICWYLSRELHKGLIKILGSWIAVWMIMLNIGNYRHTGTQSKEHTIVFICLDHKITTKSGMRIAAQID